MKKTLQIIFITIPLILLITLLPILSANNDTSPTSGSQNDTNASSTEKVAFIIPHPDDETIGAGGTIGKLLSNGTRI
ncbi:MAG: PIG-L family deacetylase, partial [Methanobacterium sp.]